MIYTLKDLQALALATGFPDPALAAAVAMAESGGNPCAQGDPIGKFLCDTPNGTSTSFGLWQVNTPHNPQYDPKSLLDPQYNARAALAISQNGATWRPWSTFKNGSYLKWYPDAVYPPGGGPVIVPQPVTPPSRSGGDVLATAGLLVLMTAVGYGVYKVIEARTTRPEPRPYFPTYPERVPVSFRRTI